MEHEELIMLGAVQKLAETNHEILTEINTNLKCVSKEIKNNSIRITSLEQSRKTAVAVLGALWVVVAGVIVSLFA